MEQVWDPGRKTLLYHNSRATIARANIFYLAGEYYSIQGAVLSETIDAFSLLPDYIASSSSSKAENQGGSFLVGLRLDSLCLTTKL